MSVTTPRPAAATHLPAIRARLARTLTLWSLAWGLVVGAVVWFTATYEVNELLDDGLQSAGELLALAVGDSPAEHGHVPARSTAWEHFAWQVLGADGQVLQRSARAPSAPWPSQPGLADVDSWRLYTLPLGSNGHVLVVAQTQAERQEAHLSVILGAALAALAVGVVGQIWLRLRVSKELAPLQGLSDRLDTWDVDAPGGLDAERLGQPDRAELLPVHSALRRLTERLQTRVASERAFSAHAAHALRTPLAGIDAQLALALRDCPPPWRERVQRARDAASRLQAVVGALLALFRSHQDVHRNPLELGELVAHLPAPRLDVHVQPGLQVHADADLLAAALLNLIDNAQRHGANTLWISAQRPGVLLLRDDGPGVDEPVRQAMAAHLQSQGGATPSGLGLLLAQRVAQAHGGALRLPPSAQGFEVELDLGPAAAAGSSA